MTKSWSICTSWPLDPSFSGFEGLPQDTPRTGCMQVEHLERQSAGGQENDVYPTKKPRISFGIHDLRAVADERRFIVLSKSILEALKSRFDADFAALIECDSAVTNDVSGLKTLFKKGSIPNDF